RLGAWGSSARCGRSGRSWIALVICNCKRARSEAVRRPLSLRDSDPARGQAMPPRRKILQARQGVAGSCVLGRSKSACSRPGTNIIPEEGWSTLTAGWRRGKRINRNVERQAGFAVDADGDGYALTCCHGRGQGNPYLEGAIVRCRDNRGGNVEPANNDVHALRI